MGLSLNVFLIYAYEIESHLRNVEHPVSEDKKRKLFALERSDTCIRQFLFPKKLFSFQDVIQTLETSVPEYNSRPSGVLFGYSPKEVLEGALCGSC
ncbi:hypothetical protein EHQ12_00585 [Leptospira gomenensis]|uniref:Uncharacterized protein n=1 Tax=Leptospira gomenensis TaxID=2484974 RepID=A0A5F1YYZ6_9LEPT|nr:hypothetical protein EHQ17_00485 [Leptospira gomenensis]TGK44271.1 hypothetical protein EHQ07_12220 [Leptospira gomenensis]TGK45059.1 hypothetical protein EHQ12_00585 [Leptospira gomenensis]TGK65133.1 hypothetical protein EHQ13_06195 [Leptospira gomenensis]